jgi:TolA-binding protein
MAEKTDVEKSYDELRREVIESRNLVIKTDNLLKNLHAELKAVGKRQEDFQKRQWISSGVAYVLFLVGVVVAATLIAQGRMANANQEREHLEHAVAELTTQVNTQKAEMAAATGSAKLAGDVYRMMTNLPGDERLKGIDALMRMDTSKLTPLERQALNDRAELLRKEIGQMAFERGRAAYHRNELTTAAEELARFMAMNPQDRDAAEASFLLGTAYNQLRKHDKAAPVLARFVEENKASKNRDYAMALLAQSYEATGQYEKAVEVAREGLGTYPNSQFASMLKARLSTAKRAMSSSGGAGDNAGQLAPDAKPAALNAPQTPQAPPAAAAGPATPAPAPPAAVPSAKPTR